MPRRLSLERVLRRCVFEHYRVCWWYEKINMPQSRVGVIMLSDLIQVCRCTEFTFTKILIFRIMFFCLITQRISGHGKEMRLGKGRKNPYLINLICLYAECIQIHEHAYLLDAFDLYSIRTKTECHTCAERKNREFDGEMFAWERMPSSPYILLQYPL